MKRQAASRAFDAQLLAIVEEFDSMSVRQVFYQAVVRGVVEKAEKEYGRVQRALVLLRRSGAMPYSTIVDGSRVRECLDGWEGLADYADSVAGWYRREMWTSQQTRVEVWCEKEGLSGIIRPVCDEYGVTFVATRGIQSLTLDYESAQNMLDKPTRLFYFGDHDPTGRHISDRLEGALREHGAMVAVERIALEPEQIKLYKLPTRPASKGKREDGRERDSRFAGFKAEYGTRAVELDALPPDVLQELVREAVESAIEDREAWDRVMAAEKAERESVRTICAGIIGVAPEGRA
ncbi:MAG: hypothetical protein M3167_02495 [Acidobacteriota bacterium]|nr:hypothetical protein [Acidobacteriota bacterium]